jgi:hypothetical protein
LAKVSGSKEERLRNEENRLRAWEYERGFFRWQEGGFGVGEYCCTKVQIPVRNRHEFQ